MQYAIISQAALMERLKRKNIHTTAQTLRDWERMGIILPPYRGETMRGRKAEYSEFVLAECFAANHLVRGDLSPAEGMFIPRLALELLGSTVSALRQSDAYVVPHYPPPPREADYPLLPPCRQTNEPKTRPLELPKQILDDPVFAYVLWMHIQETARLAWLWTVWIGCELFLTEYRE